MVDTEKNLLDRIKDSTPKLAFLGNDEKTGSFNGNCSTALSIAGVTR